MAKPGKGMLAVEEYARRKEQAALKVFGESQAALQQGQQQLLDLQRFQTEYQHQLLQKGEQATRMSDLQHYRHFIEQLDQVIGQQQQRNLILEQTVTKKRQAWLLTRTDIKRYEKLRERQREEVRTRELLQEQAILDERASHRS